MKVTKLKDGESVEGLRQLRRLNPIVPNVDSRRIANASTIEARPHKDGTDHNVRQWKILEVKEVYALTKDLRLVVLLDFEALSRVPRPETLLEYGQNILGHHCLTTDMLSAGTNVR